METTQRAITILYENGATVIPSKGTTSPQNSKAPAVNWKQYQHARPTLTDTLTLFRPGHGIGIITGAASGNLELIELEGRAANQVETLTLTAQNTGLSTLWTRLSSGWVENSPSGGIHFYLRLTSPVPGNTVLARNTSGEVLAETRGEGGYAVVAPTPGECHPTGRAWEHLIGDITTCPTFTPDEHEQLLTLFRTLNTYAPPVRDTGFTYAPTSLTTHASPGGLLPGETRPGDAYEAKNDWADILTPHGWQAVYANGGTVYWRRPGKTEGISATTGHAGDRDRLYVFSSSTQFEPQTPYTKFAAYTVLEHGGDFTAATRTLSENGYGTPPTITINPPAPTSPDTGTEPLTTTTTTSSSSSTISASATTSTSVPPEGELFPDGLLTEYHAAQAIAHEQAGHLAYIPQTRTWATWTGTRWQTALTDAPAIQAVTTWAERIQPDSGTTRAFKKRLLSNTGATAITRFLTLETSIQTNWEQFDTNPYQLNTPTGPVNLKTGKLEPPNPTDYHTKQTTTSPKNTPTPMWEKFLTQTTNHDTTKAAYLQEIAGLAAIGSPVHQILPFLHGTGANGKSVFINVIQTLLGEYAVTVPPEILIGRGETPLLIAGLKGARFAVCNEINEDTRFNEAKVKNITGADKLTGRKLYENYYEFTPSHTLFLVGNHKPNVRAGGKSFWRRLRLIGFDYTVPDDEIIPELDQKLLEAEAPGILQWVIDGAVRVLNHGLSLPESVEQASREYEKEEDQLGRFVEENLRIGGGELARVKSADLIHRYNSWCTQNGETPKSGRILSRELVHRFNLKTARDMYTRYLTNCTLYADDTEPETETNWWD